MASVGAARGGSESETSSGETVPTTTACSSPARRHRRTRPCAAGCGVASAWRTAQTVAGADGAIAREWAAQAASQQPTGDVGGGGRVRGAAWYGAGFEVQTGSLLRIVQTILESLIFFLHLAEKFSIERNITSHFFVK